MPEIDEKEYRRLKQEVEEAQAEANRAQGELDALMRTLKEDFDVTTVKEAKELLAKLERKKDETAKAFNEAVAAYEKEWKRDEPED